jgi:hypothetical protein
MSLERAAKVGRTFTEFFFFRSGVGAAHELQGYTPSPPSYDVAKVAEKKSLLVPHVRASCSCVQCCPSGSVPNEKKV